MLSCDELVCLPGCIPPVYAQVFLSPNTVIFLRGHYISKEQPLLSTQYSFKHSIIEFLDNHISIKSYEELLASDSFVVLLLISLSECFPMLFGSMVKDAQKLVRHDISVCLFMNYFPTSSKLTF